MEGTSIISGTIAALCVVILGVLVLPLAIPGRVLPGIVLEGYAMGGLNSADAGSILGLVEQSLQERTFILTLGAVTKEYTLEDLGVTINHEETLERISNYPKLSTLSGATTVAPVLDLDEDVASRVLHQDLATSLQLPRDATLRVGAAGSLSVVKSSPGEQIDILALEQDIRSIVEQQQYSEAITLHIVSAGPSIQDNEVAAAQSLATQLLGSGFVIQFEDTEYTIKPFTIRRLLSFIPQVDPTDPENEVLGVQFDEQALTEYLVNTIAPDVDQPAINARFELEKSLIEGQLPRVNTFALPQRGQALDIAATTARVNQVLAVGGRSAQLAVAVTEPEVTDTTAIKNAGVTTLLAEGVSDFVGSPVNRVHNIRVGASKYHGLLIPPGQEFSFNKYLGPVDASGGFKPELVIKTNVTVPEYGGGLCQVSTTAFRAALHSGLEITERRNHSYAVSYYGTPGFDATIYPGYTDLRFLNTTPGYILIQTRIEGTKLFFDFWGTDDGRVVEVDGPHPYNYQPNGAVKATLSQTVRDSAGQTLLEDTFYSNYKSPKLFPKVLSANGEAPTTNVTPSPNPAPSADTTNQNQEGTTTAPKT